MHLKKNQRIRTQSTASLAKSAESDICCCLSPRMRPRLRRTPAPSTRGSLLLSCHNCLWQGLIVVLPQLFVTNFSLPFSPFNSKRPVVVALWSLKKKKNALKCLHPQSGVPVALCLQRGVSKNCPTKGPRGKNAGGEKIDSQIPRGGRCYSKIRMFGPGLCTRCMDRIDGWRYLIQKHERGLHLWLGCGNMDRTDALRYFCIQKERILKSMDRLAFGDILCKKWNKLWSIARYPVYGHCWCV